MGNYTEFQRVTDILTAKDSFDSNINVSVFETNIRIIGGLLSAHLLSHRSAMFLSGCIYLIAFPSFIEQVLN